MAYTYKVQSTFIFFAAGFFVLYFFFQSHDLEL